MSLVFLGAALTLCCCIILRSSEGHVSLTFPPARTQALDFLDNARTAPPCGQPRGSGPVTDLPSETNVTVTWYLGYAHDGGYRIELLTYDAIGQASVTHTLTSSSDGLFVGGDNLTATSARVLLPPGFTCTNCTLRLVRQALNWGPRYLFWSCADVNILPANRYVSKCSGHGRYSNGFNGCTCDATYSGHECQNKDECDRDQDCGSHGQCKRVTQYSFPQKQCFCQPGWFGMKCQNVSPLSSTQFNPDQYKHQKLSSQSELELYYRILDDSKEIEIVLKGRTQSYIGIGWKSKGAHCKSGSNATKSNGVSPENPVPEPNSPVPEPLPEAEPVPEGPVNSPESGSPSPEPESPSAEPEPGLKYAALDRNGMDCTDMVIGSAIGKLSRIHDYYSPDRSTPRLDEFFGGKQSLTAAIGEETDDGMTSIIFRKPLTAMEQTDRSVENDAMVVIWAHGQAFSDTPSVGDFYRPDELKYHAHHRGMANINFFGRAVLSDAASGGSETGAAVTGEWSFPERCRTDSCDYAASWQLDANSDVISFKIRAKQQPDKWTGIAFARGKTMENMDLVYGFLNKQSQSVVVDGWVSSLFSSPTKDSSQNLLSSSLTNNNGFLTLSFSRLRSTVDVTHDYSFTHECFYFMFPVGGGLITDDNARIGKHIRTPFISDSKICISTSRRGGNSVASVSLDLHTRQIFFFIAMSSWFNFLLG